MESITRLEKYKLNITPKNFDTKDGVIENKTLGGKMYNIVSFMDHVSELKLTPLTKAEAIAIKMDIVQAAKGSQTINFSKDFLEGINFFTCSTENTIRFSFSLSSLNIKQHEVAGLYELSLDLAERELI